MGQKLSPNTFFDVGFRRKCIFKFSAIFVCLLLINSKFHGSLFQQLLTLICQIFRNNRPLPKYLIDEKLKMLAVFIFEIKGAKRDKFSNLLKGRFSVMDSPIDMIFGNFSEIYVRLLKRMTWKFVSRYSKNYNNLNVKSYLKLNSP